MWTYIARYLLALGLGLSGCPQSVEQGSIGEPVGAPCSGDQECASGLCDATCVAPKLPVAVIDGARVLVAGITLTLDGSGSSSQPPGDVLTYTWALAARPGGSAAALAGTETAQTSLTPDVAGVYDVQLVVRAGELSSTPASHALLVLGNEGDPPKAADGAPCDADVGCTSGVCEAQVCEPNGAPVAVVGSPQVVSPGSLVELDGNASSDPDGDPLTYFWQMRQTPPGSAAALDITDNSMTTFIADVAGTYAIDLWVNDGMLTSLRATQDVTASPMSACPSVGDLTNGSASCTGDYIGSTCTFSCDEGYQLSHTSAVVTCDANGDWSDSPPTCEPADCDTLPGLDNATISCPDGTKVGDTCTYTCSEGHMLTGDPSRTCQASSTWSNSEPSCDPVDCGALTAPASGSVSCPTGTEYEATCTYACDLGYALDGDANRACAADGAWSGNAPGCALIQCSPLSAPSNSGMNCTDSNHYNSSCSFACDAGYSVNGANLLTCLASGEWNAPVPSCECDNVDCAGVCDGSATVDDCGICSGGTTGIAANSCVVMSNGLMWRRCSQGQTYDPASHTCAGAATLMMYCDLNDNSCNSDTDDGDLDSDSPIWQSCDALNAIGFGGHSSWRVPTVDELLHGTVECGNSKPKPYDGNRCDQPAGSAWESEAFNQPSIDLTLFPNTAPETYWTATSAVSWRADTVNYYFGNTPTSDKYSLGPLRCVRTP